MERGNARPGIGDRRKQAARSLVSTARAEFGVRVSNVRLISLSILPSVSVRAVTNHRIFFFFVDE